jgi:hypothetical protein
MLSSITLLGLAPIFGLSLGFFVVGRSFDEKYLERKKAELDEYLRKLYQSVPGITKTTTMEDFVSADDTDLQDPRYSDPCIDHPPLNSPREFIFKQFDENRRFTRQRIAARGKCDKSFEVKEEGMALAYSFKTRGYDIGFEVRCGRKKVMQRGGRAECARATEACRAHLRTIHVRSFL